MVIPGCLGAFNMVIMRTFFQNIPVELAEAAYIDGAGELSILSKIYLPLSKPVFATMALMYGVAKWNDWFGPMIYLSDRNKYPIQLFLRNMLAQFIDTQGSAAVFDRAEISMAMAELGQSINITNTTLNYAMTVCVVLPIVGLYPFVQKYFIKGVMIGSLKG